MRRINILILLLIFILTASLLAKPEYYLVGQGDTLWNIGQRFGVSVENLILWNNLTDSGDIKLGQLLTIYPAELVELPKNAYVVKAGDTLWSISQRFSLPVTRLVEENHLTNQHQLTIGMILLIPQSTEETKEEQLVQEEIEIVEALDTVYIVHWVREGDSPWTITYQYGSELNALYQANGQLINDLQVNTKIFVPITEASSLFARCQNMNLSYSLGANETLATVAARYDLPEGLLRRINGLGDNTVVRAGRRLIMPVNQAISLPHTLHVAREGEYVFEVAYRFGLEISSILAANYLTDSHNLLPAGLTLVIPTN